MSNLFRTKPVVKEARQWFKSGDHPAVRSGFISPEGAVVDPTNRSANIHGCRETNVIKTLEGWHEVNFGDWIIRGIKGEFYPCKPDIFDATYEKVMDDT